jgi:hypothetical protein
MGGDHERRTNQRLSYTCQPGFIGLSARGLVDRRGAIVGARNDPGQARAASTVACRSNCPIRTDASPSISKWKQNAGVQLAGNVRTITMR